jgi:hypothetical protein
VKHIAQSATPACRRLSAGTARAVLAAALLAAQLAHAAPPTPFTYGVVDLFDAVSGTRAEAWSPADPVTVTDGTPPGASGSVRTEFGSNGFAVEAPAGLRGAGAGSIWSDGFRVAGSGTGTLALSVQIEGSIAGGADMFYDLFVSGAAFDAQAIVAVYDVTDYDRQLPGAVRLLHTAVANGCGTPSASAACGHVPFENFQGAFNLTLTGTFQFDYNQDYYLASVLGGDVSDNGPGGQASFLNSARFGISVLTGGKLESLAGPPGAVGWRALARSRQPGARSVARATSVLSPFSLNFATRWVGVCGSSSRNTT